ncbi:MAG: DUF1592 domain-containing protein [Rubripirellula sp.]|nr:DUF1592 domain-containing protein [Rubripirellula sp.]
MSRIGSTPWLDTSWLATSWRCLLRIAFLCVTALNASSVDAAPPTARLPEKHQAFLKTHCFDCHDAATQEGKVNLESLSFQISSVAQAEAWQKILGVLNSGEMPPEDSEQPANAEKADFLDDLAQTMVTARRRLSDAGGKITMRRLNRREYKNTIHQLIGVTVDVKSLPADSSSGAFDTTGASLFLSSDQLEHYLKLGRTAIDELFERQAVLREEPRVFRVEPEITVNPQSLNAIRAMESVYERHLLWKAEVDRAVLAPENREVLNKLRDEYPDLEKGSRVRLYQNADRLIGLPDAKKFGFRDAKDADFSYRGGYERKYAYLKHYAELPANDRGTYLKLAWGIQRIDVSPGPKNLPPGRYKLKIHAGVVEGSPPSRHFIEIGAPQRVNGVPAGFTSLPISSHQVTGTIDGPETIATELEVSAHTQREFGIQERQPIDKKSLRDAYNRDKRGNGYGVPPAVWIDWIELEGPLPETGAASPLHRILAKHLGTPKRNPSSASESADRARAILSEFAEVAVRDSKPDEAFIDKLVAIYETRQNTGEPFEIAIRTPLSIILASPGFLYLNEPGDNEAPRALNDRELAIRLSYFLWSSPPDKQLQALAATNQLHQPKILRQQVDRMIRDPRSAEFVSGFVHQWLDMERLDFFQFDAGLHREFDENTRKAAREEVYQSFAYLLRDPAGGPLGNLLKSDYVIINGLLATYYELDGVTGDEFRKVKLPANSPRGGLLGMAAIHAMGSDGIVSSPVERGAWVLRHLLNDPPPPAPPNVPQISRLEDQLLTARERLLAHQEEAQCASCHRKIDPIGFGLENWGAAGKWRTEDIYRLANKKGKKTGKAKTWAIDAAGKFHRGPAFSNYFELRNLIAEREEDFARCFAEHLIEYGLGRPFGFTDEDLANEIVNSARSQQFALNEFVQSLILSKPFRMK